MWHCLWTILIYELKLWLRLVSPSVLTPPDSPYWLFLTIFDIFTRYVVINANMGLFRVYTLLYAVFCFSHICYICCMAWINCFRCMHRVKAVYILTRYVLFVANTALVAFCVYKLLNNFSVLAIFTILAVQTEFAVVCCIHENRRESCCCRICWIHWIRHVCCLVIFDLFTRYVLYVANTVFWSMYPFKPIYLFQPHLPWLLYRLNWPFLIYHRNQCCCRLKYLLN